VYSWVKTYKEHGEQALLTKPIPGRPAKLSDAQARAVYAVLVGKDPRQLQFDFTLWTRWMVGELIKRMDITGMIDPSDAGRAGDYYLAGTHWGLGRVAAPARHQLHRCGTVLLAPVNVPLHPCQPRVTLNKLIHIPLALVRTTVLPLSSW
jgi:hypothetical protein